MTDEHPDDAWVREILAASAAPPPQLPAEVAARLDDALTDLVAERAGTPGHAAEGRAATAAPAPVALASRRRRWPTVLDAAAAASVAAVALGQGLLNAQDPTATESQEPAAGLAGPPRGPEDAAGGRVAADDETDRDADGPVDAVTGDARAVRAPRLSSESLNADVQRVLALTAPLTRDEAYHTRTWAECPVPPTPSGSALLRVRLDGERALLVLGAPHQGQRRAEVYTCDDPGQPAASTTVDVR